jgi:(S)-2-hydroxy-acid oxidase
MASSKPDRKYVSTLEFEEYAKQTATKNAFNYYVSGANGQYTLKENIDAFQRIKLKARIMRNVKNIDLSTTIFGRKVSLPLGISPTAMHKLVDPEGEVATARAARNKDIIYTLSTLSTTSIADGI